MNSRNPRYVTGCRTGMCCKPFPRLKLSIGKVGSSKAYPGTASTVWRLRKRTRGAVTSFLDTGTLSDSLQGCVGTLLFQWRIHSSEVSMETLTMLSGISMRLPGQKGSHLDLIRREEHNYLYNHDCTTVLVCRLHKLCTMHLISAAGLHGKAY